MILNLREISKGYTQKLSKIKVALFDVDGVLTNGLIHWDGESIGFNRATHTQDGYGLKILMQAGIKVGVISGGNSLGVIKRFRENLNLDFVFLGSEDKRGAYQEVLDLGFCDEQILYMGDEFFDIPLLKRAGFSATVPDSSIEVREAVDYVTTRPGGMACVREVIDLLRHAQEIIPKIEDFASEDR
jgi:3-deoxy-D-manno-octulosonate 8-phosphate phosphatase (KDO 8-P phosphatase)